MFTILMLILMITFFCLSIIGGGYLGMLMFPGLAFQAGAIAAFLWIVVLISAIFLTGAISIQKLNPEEIEEIIKDDKEEK